jgi:hypothetical protein
VSILAFIGGVEAVVLVLILAKIKQNARLVRQLQQLYFELAMALSLASQGRFNEAEEAARTWRERMRALERGETYHPPRPRTAPDPPFRKRATRQH